MDVYAPKDTLEYFKNFRTEDNKNINKNPPVKRGGFGEQLNIIYNACYQLDSIILPTMDAEMIKSIYGEYEEEFTLILDTIDELIKIANND